MWQAILNLNTLNAIIFFDLYKEVISSITAITAPNIVNTTWVRGITKQLDSIEMFIEPKKSMK